MLAALCKSASMFDVIKKELDSILTRDPAARNRLEVALCYPGFHAMLAYRAADLILEDAQ